MSEEKDTIKIPTLADHHYYLFNKEFDATSCGELMTFIIERNLITAENDRPDCIRVMLNSPGGDLASAFALIDVMESSRIPIYTYGYGLIASAALLTFITGAKGHRYVTKNTSILSHQFSWGSSGKMHELYANVKEFDLTRERMHDHYKKHTKQTEANIKKYLLPPEDVWMSSKEALKFGIADKIINSF